MNPIRRTSHATRRIARGAWMIALATAAQGCGAAPQPEAADAAPPAAVTSAAAVADAATADAATVVTSLYRDHFAHEQNWGATYQRQRALFAPELAALLDADDSASAANADEVVGLDFDPLTDAQDTMTGFEVGPATRDGVDAVVPVTLRLDTARSEVRIRLARSGEAWHVANIHYAHGDLASLLRRLATDRRRSP